MFPGLVSPCDPRGWLTPPCSPTADQGPWAQARFGPPVSRAQPGSEAAEQGAWGRLEKPGLRCAPAGPPSSDGHRGAVASVLWVPAVVGLSAGLRSSSSGGPESLVVQPVCVVKGRLSVAVVAVLHKCTFLKNKLVIHSE